MYRIMKTFHFEAAHRLENLPPGHKCQNLHGHNYTVELILESRLLDSASFVVDYGELSKKFGVEIEELDHAYLNDVVKFSPTAENLARYLFELADAWWPRMVAAVRVSETPNTWAEYTED